MKKKLTFIVFLIFTFLFCNTFLLNANNNETQEYKFIDIHSHIFKQDQDLKEISNMLKENNVEYICLSGYYSKSKNTDSFLDKMIIDVSKNNKNFIPFLRGFNLIDRHSIKYVEEMLATNLFKAIGELEINGHGTVLGADSPIMMEIYKLASKYDVPVLMLFTFGSSSKNEPGGVKQINELKNALSQNPNTKIIVAHCGAGPFPQNVSYQKDIEELLKSYPNLYFDIAGMHIEFYKNDTLNPLAKIIIEFIKKYPDRFLVGFDFDDIMFPYENGKEIIQFYKKFLENFEWDIIKKISYENAKKILKL